MERRKTHNLGLEAANVRTQIHIFHSRFPNRKELIIINGYTKIINRSDTILFTRSNRDRLSATTRVDERFSASGCSGGSSHLPLSWEFILEKHKNNRRSKLEKEKCVEELFEEIREGDRPWWASDGSRGRKNRRAGDHCTRAAKQQGE